MRKNFVGSVIVVAIITTFRFGSALFLPLSEWRARMWDADITRHVFTQEHHNRDQGGGGGILSRSVPAAGVVGPEANPVDCLIERDGGGDGAPRLVGGVAREMFDWVRGYSGIRIWVSSLATDWGGSQVRKGNRKVMSCFSTSP